jgi:hypothetical protein
MTKRFTPKIVGGTDHTPQSANQYGKGRLERRRASLMLTGSDTAKNAALRLELKTAWRRAEATTRFWRTRLDFTSAVSLAQNAGVPAARGHEPETKENRFTMAHEYRTALVEQLLTPAWDYASANWKRAVVARDDYVFRGGYVEKAQVERAIAEDSAFLAAHPTRRPKGRQP